MSKVGLTLLGLLLAVSMTTFADAQNVATGGKPENATKITISGEVDLISYWRDEAINEIIENEFRRDVPDGILGDDWDYEGDSATVLYYRLRFDVELADKVAAVVEFENRPLRSQNFTNTGHEAHAAVFGDQTQGGFDVNLGEAYIQASEFLWQPLTLKAGIQNLCYDLRKNGRPFFIDLRNAELAFISPLQESFYGMFYPATGMGNSWATTNNNGYFRDQNREAGGWKLTYAEGAVTLDMFWMTVFETLSTFGPGSNSSANHVDEALFGVNFDYALDENSLLRTVFAIISNDSWNNRVYTIGAGIDYYVLPELELYGELYYQWGKYGEWVGNGGLAIGASDPEDDIPHRSWAGIFGGKYTFQDVAVKPWIDLSFTYLDGDECEMEGNGSATANVNHKPETNNDFVSYENNNATLILENSILGLDIDSNYWKVQVEAGITFDLMNEADTNLSVLYAYAKLVNEPKRVNRDSDDPTGNTGADWDLDDKLGQEVDIRCSWAYSKSLTFALNLGWLWNADFFERDDAAGAPFVGANRYHGYGISDDVNIFMGTFDVLLKF
jgi:hypothetical protein